MLGKRVEDPLGSIMWDDLFKRMRGRPGVSSATHALSSSAPSASGHGSANVMQDPVPNPPLSTANPGHVFVEPASPSSEVGLDHEITEITEVQFTQLNPKLNSNPSKNSDSNFNWDHRQNKVDTPPRPPRKPPPHIRWPSSAYVPPCLMSLHRCTMWVYL